jgi:hypothetical protein
MAGNTDLGWYPAGQAKLNHLSSILKECHNGANLTQTRYCSADWSWFIGQTPYAYTTYETYLTNNYFGDPEMMYYTKEPVRFIAEVTPRHIGLDEDNPIVVTIKNLAFHQKAIVCLYQATANGGEYQVIQEIDGMQHGDETATFIIPANKLNTGVLYVTVSGFNFMPFTDEIFVSPGCAKNPNTLVVNTTPSLPWGDRFINQDVTISSGVTLTITGKVYFVHDCKITVMPGAKLIIDGGTLASSCEALWDGIDIVGQSNLTQYSNTNQGFVQVTNSGCIQDAKIALGTAQTTANGFASGTTGGKFSCTNAKFLNNNCSIHIYPYQFGNNNYNSTISNTDFIKDSKYIGSALTSPMVIFEHIIGIGTSGLTFTNSMTSTSADARGIGILANDAGFRLTHICLNGNQIPCTNYRRSKFSGLYYGIQCQSTGASKSVLIENSDFDNTSRGIYLSAVTNPSITQCTFKTKAESSFNQSTNNSGIYLDACTGYGVQENTFTGNYGGGALTYETGIVINNTGTSPNEIYNNTFTKLQNGITAQDDNRGLVCKCNDYSNVKFDQSALVSGTPGSLGIAPMQGASGSVTSPAGNTFSPQHATLQIPESDLKNQGAGFQYFHHVQAQSGLPPRVEPIYFSSSIGRQNTGWGYDKSIVCPSRLNGGGGGTPIESSVEKLVQQQVLIDSLETGLDNLVDGGNTEETAADIVFSNPEEALDIYNDLLTKSPYLSDTVMTEAVTKEGVISNPLLHDILVANPQSAISEDVLDQLDQRVDPMPEDLYNDILNGENILAPLTAEKASIAALKTDNATLYYHLMNRYLSDTSEYATDSLLYLLNVKNTLEAAYMEAFIHLGNGDYTAMNSTLSGISSEFDLSNKEQLLHGYYQQFFALLQQMQTDTLPDLQADSLTIVQLQILLENAPEPVKSFTRNILVANNAIEYHEPYLYDDGLKSFDVKKNHRMGASTKQVLLEVFPNPAKEYIIVRYKFANELSDAQETAVLEMVTTTGQVIKSLILHEVTGQVIVSTKAFVPGVYIIHIKGLSKKVETAKFTVVH